MSFQEVANQFSEIFVVINDQNALWQLAWASSDWVVNVAAMGRPRSSIEICNGGVQVRVGMSMPRMNGIEAAPRLKKLLPQTPIILFTSHSAFRIFDVGAVGIDAVVGKHDSMLSLKESLQALLQEA